MLKIEEMLHNILGQKILDVRGTSFQRKKFSDIHKGIHSSNCYGGYQVEPRRRKHPDPNAVKNHPPSKKRPRGMPGKINDKLSSNNIMRTVGKDKLVVYAG